MEGVAFRIKQEKTGQGNCDIAKDDDDDLNDIGSVQVSSVENFDDKVDCVGTGDIVNDVVMKDSDGVGIVDDLDERLMYSFTTNDNETISVIRAEEDDEESEDEPDTEEGTEISVHLNKQNELNSQIVVIEPSSSTNTSNSCIGDNYHHNVPVTLCIQKEDQFEPSLVNVGPHKPNNLSCNEHNELRQRTCFTHKALPGSSTSVSQNNPSELFAHLIEPRSCHISLLEYNSSVRDQGRELIQPRSNHFLMNPSLSSLNVSSKPPSCQKRKLKKDKTRLPNQKYNFDSSLSKSPSCMDYKSQNVLFQVKSEKESEENSKHEEVSMESFSGHKRKHDLQLSECGGYQNMSVSKQTCSAVLTRFDETDEFKILFGKHQRTYSKSRTKASVSTSKRSKKRGEAKNSREKNSRHLENGFSPSSDKCLAVESLEKDSKRQQTDIVLNHSPFSEKCDPKVDRGISIQQEYHLILSNRNTKVPTFKSKYTTKGTLTSESDGTKIYRTEIVNCSSNQKAKSGNKLLNHKEIEESDGQNIIQTMVECERDLPAQRAWPCVITPKFYSNRKGKTKITKTALYCLFCDKVVQTIQVLWVHMKVHRWAPGKLVLCGHCNEDFFSVNCLKEHFENRHREHLLYTCGICDLDIPSEQILPHLGQHKEANLNYQCGLCEKKLGLAEGLKSHLQKHCKQILYKCGICFTIHKDREEFETDLKLHYKEWLSCDEWTKKYDLFKTSSKQSVDLGPCSKHVQTSSHQNGWTPEPSSGKFDQERNIMNDEKGRELLSTEMEVTSGEGPHNGQIVVLTPKLHASENVKLTVSKSEMLNFYCLFCYKGFRNFHTFKLHSSNHKFAPRKVILCGHCNQEFYFLQCLKEHFENEHKEYFGYVCNVCNLEIPREHLFNHLEKFKEKSLGLKCGVCDEIFSQIDDLKTHLDDHDKQILYKCGICFLNHRNRDDFETHLRIHYEAQFRCNQCNMKFHSAKILNKHANVHKIPNQV